MIIEYHEEAVASGSRFEIPDEGLIFDPISTLTIKISDQEHCSKVAWVERVIIIPAEEE